MALERILEPEASDTLEAARDYEAMDHAEDNRLFVDDLLAVGSVGRDVFDLGTGTALIPIELCQRFEECRVMAADRSTYMLDLARLNIEIAGLIDRIMLDHVDARQLPYADGYFDLVMCNGTLHHFAAPITVLREALRVVNGGGLLFFRDLARPESDESVRQLVETYAGPTNERQQEMFDHALRAALNRDEMRDLVQQLGFDAQTVRATSDRHWTWIARKQGG